MRITKQKNVANMQDTISLICVTLRSNIKQKELMLWKMLVFYLNGESFWWTGSVKYLKNWMVSSKSSKVPISNYRYSLKYFSDQWNILFGSWTFGPILRSMRNTGSKAGYSESWSNSAFHCCKIRRNISVSKFFSKLKTRGPRTKTSFPLIPD